MNKKDRIRLAEAMWSVESSDLRCGERRYLFRHLPDPATYANDDYEVLDWMREKFGEQSLEFAEYAEYLPLIESYRIGDYARAALKVMDDE